MEQTLEMIEENIGDDKRNCEKNSGTNKDNEK